jgi:hypothetical protein
MRLRASVALVLFGLLAACGDDDATGPESDLNHGGVGNQTLLVMADIDVDPRPGGFETRFEVDVSDRDGEPVSGAEVVIEGNFSPLELSEDSPGTYTAEFAGAASGTLTLRVEEAGTYVREVVLGNIGIHAFIEPSVNDSVPADVDLLVRWASDSEAPFARLTTRDAGFDVEDTGRFVVPDSLNSPRSSQRFELLRYNEVQIAGGLRGSYFRMEVRRALEPVVVYSESQ